MQIRRKITILAIVLAVGCTWGADTGTITDVVTDKVVAVTMPESVTLSGGKLLEVVRDGKVVGRLEVKTASGICRVLEGEVLKGDTIRLAGDVQQEAAQAPDEKPPPEGSAPASLPPGLHEVMCAQGDLEVALLAANGLPAEEQTRLAELLAAAEDMLPRLYPAARLTQLPSLEARVAAMLTDANQAELAGQLDVPAFEPELVLAPIWPEVLPAELRPVYGEISLIEATPGLWASLDLHDNEPKPAACGGWSFDGETLTGSPSAMPLVRSDFTLRDVEVEGEIRVDQGVFLYIILRSGIIVKFHGKQTRDRPGGVTVRYGRQNLAVNDAVSAQPVILAETWQRLRVRLEGEALTVEVDGNTVLETQITESIMGEANTTPLRGYIGFGTYQATGSFRGMVARGLTARDRQQLPRLRMQEQFVPQGNAVDVLRLPPEQYIALTNEAEEAFKSGQHVVEDGILTIRGASYSQFSAKGLAGEHWRASGRLRVLRRGTVWFRANRRLLFGLEAVSSEQDAKEGMPFMVSHSATDYRSPEQQFAGRPLVIERWYDWQLDYHHPLGAFTLNGERIMQATTPETEDLGPTQLGISAYIARLEVTDLKVQPLKAAAASLELQPGQVESLLTDGLQAAHQAAEIWQETQPVAAATILGERAPVIATEREIRELAESFRENYDWSTYLALLKANYERFSAGTDDFRSGEHQWKLAKQKYDIALEMAEVGDLGLDSVLRVGETPGPMTNSADRRHLWISIPERNQLVKYDPVTRQLVQRLPIDFKPAGLQARRDFLLVVEEGLTRIRKLDADTGKQLGVLEIPKGKLMDLDSDPLRPRTWLSINENEPDLVKFDQFKIYRLDEATMELQPTPAIGMFMALDPLGRFLYTGFSVRLAANLDPAWLMFMPVRGFGDNLLAYRIAGQDLALELESDLPAPGVAGTQIVPDPQGNSVAYVARGGFWTEHNPGRGGPSVGLFPAGNLRHQGKLLATGTGISSLCFHPFAPIAYAYNGQAVLKLNTETGERLGTIPLPEGIGRQAVRQMCCSPSGLELAISFEGKPGGVYLRRLAVEADLPHLPVQLASLPPEELLTKVRAALADDPETGRQWLEQVASDFAFTSTGEAAAEQLLEGLEHPLLVAAAPPILPPGPSEDLPELPRETPELPVAPATLDLGDEPTTTETDTAYLLVLESLDSLKPLALTYPHSWLWRCLQEAGDNADQPELRLIMAEVYAAEGEADMARTMAGRALAVAPVGSDSAMHAYSLLARQAPTPADKLAALQEALRLEPRNAFFQRRMGDACAEAGQPNRAAWHWLLAYSLYPSQVDLRAKLEDLKLLPALPQLQDLQTADLYQKVSGSVVLVRQKEGVGTGFFISRDGLLLTNCHVVGPGEGLTITFGGTGAAPQHTLPATIVGMNPQKDMALLRVDLGELSIEPLIIGARRPPVAGEAVIAIGNPGMGTAVLTQTITEGIISNLSRAVGGQTYLQTSAAVNPGNSGGPLFNKRGAVIGMITLKAHLDNVGFAIPASLLLPFVEATMNY